MGRARYLRDMSEALRAPSFDDLYRQLQALPDHLGGQIIGGELVALPRPGSPHANAAGGLLADLRTTFQRGSGGNPGSWWILMEPELRFGNEIYSPDLAGWKRERLPTMPRRGRIEVTPDWVCEVLSTRTRRKDRTIKSRTYNTFGVSWMWIVDPLARTLEAYRKEGAFWTSLGTWGGDERVRAEPFDAVELDLAHWWEGVEPEPEDDE